MARFASTKSVVAPGFSVAVAISVGLAVTSFGQTQGLALAAATSPPATASPSAISAPAAAAPALTVGHHVLARVGAADFKATYLPVDDPLNDASPSQIFRVRFQLHNGAPDPVTAIPQLEYRTGGAGAYVVVPEKSKPGIAFRAASEKVPGVLGEDIVVGDLLMGAGGGQAVSGHHSMGSNPDVPITLQPSSYTEEELTVALTSDATDLAAYQLRITDGGTPMTGTAVAVVRLGTATTSTPAPPLTPAPAPPSSPGTTPGTASTPSTPSTPGTPGPPSTPGATPGIPGTPDIPGTLATYGSPGALGTPATPSTPLSPATSTVPSGSASASPDAAASPDATGKAGAASANLVRYALVAAAPAAAAAPSTDSIHGPYSMTTDKCAACHRGHTAKAPNLVKEAGPQSNLCFTCHDGTGAANLNVKSQYTDPALPKNVPATREYYSHDVASPTTHTGSDPSELLGVSNRHSECADCHNPHNASATTISASTATGWTASTRVAGATGVSVENGAAGTEPTYAAIAGEGSSLTREYQLCFKCHSGFTKLPDNAGFAASSALFDKAVEFNPDNPSFHPIEAKGTNQTAAMDVSLAGTGFTSQSTIRCSNCHAGSAAISAGTRPAPGADLAPHASQNRGILLANYQDRVLKSSGDGYKDADFALCLMCHARAPFSGDGDDLATNFNLHAKHLSDLDGTGAGGTNIDTPGDGQGNAICAECHFRLHSTTNKVGAQVIDGTRLVNFAPNVQGVGAIPPTWTPSGTASGTCTLTCHGKKHNPRRY